MLLSRGKFRQDRNPTALSSLSSTFFLSFAWRRARLSTYLPGYKMRFYRGCTDSILTSSYILQSGEKRSFQFSKIDRIRRKASRNNFFQGMLLCRRRDSYSSKKRNSLGKRGSLKERSESEGNGKYPRQKAWLPVRPFDPRTTVRCFFEFSFEFVNGEIQVWPFPC